ncbi:MAG TPA: hypothetical protein VGN57_15220 [Pirellulaceae bacterium]|jgi:hypothetical protein|nr:hypothetical protein [Pirellulaceae bacterium]
MAKLHRFSRRYGRTTLAALGSFLVTLGCFMVVLAAATVSREARADQTTCYLSSTQLAGHTCTPVDYQGQPYYSCCEWCGQMAGDPADHPEYTCTNCFTDPGGNMYCECCGPVQPPPPCPGASCDNGQQCATMNQLPTCVGIGTCKPFGSCNACNCVPNAANTACECR